MLNQQCINHYELLKKELINMRNNLPDFNGSNEDETTNDAVSANKGIELNWQETMNPFNTTSRSLSRTLNSLNTLIFPSRKTNSSHTYHKNVLEPRSESQRHEDIKHSVSITKMCDYESFLKENEKKCKPLRYLHEEDEIRSKVTAFGNPFKLTSSTSSNNNQSKPRKPITSKRSLPQFEDISVPRPSTTIPLLYEFINTVDPLRLIKDPDGVERDYQQAKTTYLNKMVEEKQKWLSKLSTEDNQGGSLIFRRKTEEMV